MASRSTIHSLVALALAGCYEEPAIQLEVTRSSGENLEYAVCDASGEHCKCASESLFLSDDDDVRNRRVAIFVHDDRPAVTLALFVQPLQGPALDTCHVVSLGDDIVVRQVNLSSTMGLCDRDTCDPGYACEKAIVCAP